MRWSGDLPANRERHAVPHWGQARQRAPSQPAVIVRAIVAVVSGSYFHAQRRCSVLTPPPPAQAASSEHLWRGNRLPALHVMALSSCLLPMGSRRSHFPPSVSVPRCPNPVMGRVCAMSDRLRFLNHTPRIILLSTDPSTPRPPGPVLCGPECGRGLFSILHLRAARVALTRVTSPAQGRWRLSCQRTASRNSSVALASFSLSLMRAQ